MGKDRNWRWVDIMTATVFAVVLLWSFCIGPIIDNGRGRHAGLAAAQSDIAKGHLRLQLGGYPSSRVHRQTEAIARERYGIEIVSTGCVPTDYQSAYSAAYNAEMQHELDRRSSDVSLDVIVQEAVQIVDADPTPRP